ncbi:MAG: hypothetical protein KDD22_07400 [Bdellovibrionales bacterium]|nr:hypothetical protein [Bdellovibrionales bacterium]
MSHFVKILFLVLALSCLALATHLAFKTYQQSHMNLAQKVYFLWERDLKTLEAHHKLPNGFFHLREVKLKGATPLTHKWLKKTGSPLRLDPQGQFSLEVLMLHWMENNTLGVVIQYNLTDLKTGDMVWELGRTFTLPTPTKKPTSSASGSDKPSEAPPAPPPGAN